MTAETGWWRYVSNGCWQRVPSCRTTNSEAAWYVKIYLPGLAGLWTSNLGKRAQELGMVQFERASVTSY